MDDVLSDILRLVRVESCVYFLRDFRAPWGIAIPQGKVAQFHAVVHGHCVVEINSRSVSLSTGDVILLPHGNAHVLADSCGSPAQPAADVMASFRSECPAFVTGDRVTQILCGHFAYRSDLRHPLFAELPKFVHEAAYDAASHGTLAAVLPLLTHEMKTQQPGSESVIERFAEILLVQLLRLYVNRLPQRRGFLAGISDGRIARAVRVVHRDHDQNLSIQRLADAAGMSRTAFAQHFKRLMGVTPIDYLTQWRMYQASELLTSNGLTLADIAARIGYDSDVAFSRAFKRQFQISPSAYRRAARTDAG